MQIHDVRARLLALPGATPTYPFGPQPLVVKVMGKMFALLDETSDPLNLSLKCEPAHAQFLRDSFPAITAGYHLNKQHWNTVVLDGSIPVEGIQSMIEESYRLVVAGLSRAARAQLSSEV